MAAGAIVREKNQPFLAKLECEEEIQDENDPQRLKWSDSQCQESVMCGLSADPTNLHDDYDMIDHDDVIVRSRKDEGIHGDERVLKNLLTVEDKLNFSSSSLYFNFQDDIKPYMRKMVTMWMLDVCTEQERDEGVFLLAVTILDKFLAVVKIKRTRLQLSAAVCLLLSSKIREAYPFTVDKLVAYTDYSVSHEELTEWEMFLIQSLNWDIVITTAYDFIDVMLHRLPVNVGYHSLVSRHAQTFVSLCATEHYFLMFPPSVLAAATLLASINGLIGQLPANKEEVEKSLHRITHIDIDCIKACQEQIELLCSHNISSQFLMEEPQPSQSPPPPPPSPPPVTPPINSHNYVTKSSSNHVKVHHNDQPIASSSTPTDVTDVQLD